MTLSVRGQRSDPLAAFLLRDVNAVSGNLPKNAFSSFSHSLEEEKNREKEENAFFARLPNTLNCLSCQLCGLLYEVAVF